jgi:Uma2 family endonuclease
MSTTTRITLEQYDEMIRQGVFEPREEHHVELIQGEVRDRSPIGPPHSVIVGIMNEWSIRQLPGDLITVRVQQPIGIPALDSEPEPDLVVARRGDYFIHHPRPADIPLVVEVADTSLAFDRGAKAALYAAADIQDYWIVNWPQRCVEVSRMPHEGRYTSLQTLHPGQEVRPLAFPDVALPVSRLFAP